VCGALACAGEIAISQGDISRREFMRELTETELNAVSGGGKHVNTGQIITNSQTNVMIGSGNFSKGGAKQKNVAFNTIIG
jgi:bacteriocin-like protein